MLQKNKLLTDNFGVISVNQFKLSISMNNFKANQRCESSCMGFLNIKMLYEVSIAIHYYLLLYSCI